MQRVSPILCTLMLLFKPDSVTALCILWGSATLVGVRASSSSGCGHDHNARYAFLSHQGENLWEIELV